ncbi:OLC1v1027216C1 [Oldenlandia corymbosa var. corymbosa]|uniref:OLC1v1027216C1 n=1 Tax=Oldenlandia corymbosa var. corymbosa TaxID=529605 RepID=A0AAV1C8Y2_OLDCO|nr:OLC1v1027216C1 [Oldenlandia corymbosa var. corymbosa]
MTISLPPNLCHCELSVCRKRSTGKQSQQNLNQNKKSKLSFPKAKPTPLLTNRVNSSLTKLQALEFVIKDLETSSKRGIEINDTDIFASLLETCFKLGAFDHALRVHRLIPGKLVRKNVGISSKLIRIYACSGLMEEAHQLFDIMPKRDESAFPWNSLIAGYADMNLHEDALALYFQMVEEGVEPDEYTFPRVLKACGGIGSIQIAEEIHRHMIRYGYGNDGFALNAMVDVYAKCGDILKARKVFDRIRDKDLVSWNSMVKGYIRHELQAEAMNLVRTMVREGFKPDSVTLSALFTSVSSLKLGRQIHGWALRNGIGWDLSVANALIVFYSNSNRLTEACLLFEHMPRRDSVTWNSIIAAHSKDRKALVYFQRMKTEANALPDRITFVSLLSGCAYLGLVEDGEKLFSMMRNEYGISPIMEHYACMVNLYSRAGLIDKAHDIIVEKMESAAGATVWGALLYGCYLHGNVEVAEIAATALFELEPDNELNFELLMKVYTKADRNEDVERVRRMMVERGLDC